MRAALRGGCAHQQPRRTPRCPPCVVDVRTRSSDRLSALTVTVTHLACHPALTVLIAPRITDTAADPSGATGRVFRVCDGVFAISSLCQNRTSETVPDARFDGSSSTSDRAAIVRDRSDHLSKRTAGVMMRHPRQQWAPRYNESSIRDRRRGIAECLSHS